VRKFCTIRTFPHCLYRHQLRLRVSFTLHGDLYLTLKLQKTHIFIIMCHAACWLPNNSRLLQIIAFYDFVFFVSVVSRQFISFVTKMEVVARITSTRLVFTSLLRIWDRIDLVITVNTSSQSQWNAKSFKFAFSPC